MLVREAEAFGAPLIANASWDQEVARTRAGIRVPAASPGRVRSSHTTLIGSRITELDLGQKPPPSQSVLLGRVLDAVARRPDADNTLIVYIVGDNGSSSEGGREGTINENNVFNAVADIWQVSR